MELRGAGCPVNDNFRAIPHIISGAKKTSRDYSREVPSKNYTNMNEKITHFVPIWDRIISITSMFQEQNYE